MNAISLQCALILLLQTAVTVSSKTNGKEEHGRLHKAHHYNEEKIENKEKQEITKEESYVTTDFDPSTFVSTTTGPGACPICGHVENLAKVYEGLSEERIVEGEEAGLHAHPWQIALMTENYPTVWCGAVLITDQYALTAAHCAKRIHPDEEVVYAVLGTNIISAGKMNESQQLIPVYMVKIHEDYNPLSLANDIALLYLQDPAVLGPTVLPICLPESDANYTGIMATISGWGRLTENGEFSDTLQEAEVQVVSFEECTAVYTEGSVTQNHVCAGGNGKDTCQADSGGPLVMEGKEGSKVLIGITSWGKGCGRPGVPGVYVRVANYLEWIAEQVTTDTCEYLTQLPVNTAVPDTSSSNYSCSCGIRNTGNRIIGGVETKLHEFPWQVAIVSYYGIKPFCGAVIVSDKWILTAAHCADEMHLDDQLMIGEHDWKHASETLITLRRTIAQIIVHPDYDDRPMDSDLALLMLREPLDFSQYNNAIAPVCFPPPYISFEGSKALVSGWGLVRFGGFQSLELRVVQVPIVSRAACILSYGHYITENMICAGYKSGGKDACQGDSGGPLVVEDKNGSYVLAGIVSWGLKCAMPNYYGVYAKVNNFLPWIQSYVGGTNTCKNS